MRSLGRTAWLLTTPASAIALALYALPILQVLALSVTEPSFGWANYEHMLTNPAVGHVVETTLRIALLTTVLTVLASYVIALSLIHMSSAARRVAFFLVLVPFWISVLVRAFSRITILRRQERAGSMAPRCRYRLESARAGL